MEVQALNSTLAQTLRMRHLLARFRNIGRVVRFASPNFNQKVAPFIWLKNLRPNNLSHFFSQERISNQLSFRFSNIEFQCLSHSGPNVNFPCARFPSKNAQHDSFQSRRRNRSNVRLPFSCQSEDLSNSNEGD